MQSRLSRRPAWSEHRWGGESCVRWGPRRGKGAAHCGKLLGCREVTELEDSRWPVFSAFIRCQPYQYTLQAHYMLKKSVDSSGIQTMIRKITSMRKCSVNSRQDTSTVSSDLIDLQPGWGIFLESGLDIVSILHHCLPLFLKSNLENG